MQTQVAIDNPEMQLPLIHMNGNSGTALGNQYFEALNALSRFQEKFIRIEFHQRDYYPLGDEAWQKAKAQRMIQKENIASLYSYLELHAQHCFCSER
jgi:hypothetical protein